REQDALGIETREQDLEALSLFADQGVLGHVEMVDEERVALHGLAAHFRDRLRLDVAAVEIRVEQRQTVGRPFRFGLRRRSRDQQYLGRGLRVGGPDLPSAYAVAAVGAFGAGLE